MNHTHLSAKSKNAGNPVRAGLKRNKPSPLTLEPRLMFDGAALSTVIADHAHDASSADHALPIERADATREGAQAVASDRVAKEIVFVDAGVRDWQKLVATAGPTAEVVVLDASRDGLTQIAEALQGRSEIDAMHVVSHGVEGGLTLGETTYTEQSLGAYQAQLAQIGHALTESGDILLYGCDVAKGSDGAAFTDAIARATSADVAASSDTTGNAAQGGDWNLEYTSGTISASAFAARATLDSYEGTLAADKVTAEDDKGNVDQDATLAATSSVLTNDKDSKGHTLTVTDIDHGFTDGSVGTPLKGNFGSLTIKGDGTYTYIADNAKHLGFNETGKDTFTYTVSDSHGKTDTAKLVITVKGLDDLTVTQSDIKTVDEDHSAIGNVLANDSDFDGDLRVSQFEVNGTTYSVPNGFFSSQSKTATVAGGSLTIHADGEYSFKPSDNWNGTVPTVTYTAIDDSSGSTKTDTLKIIVNPVDDPSDLKHDSKTAEEDNVASGNVLSNDKDVDNTLAIATFEIDGTTYNVGATAAIVDMGTLTMASNGDYAFTPSSNWNGDVPRVTYTTNTGSSSHLDITITPVSDPTIISGPTNSNGDIVINIGENDRSVTSEASNQKLFATDGDGPAEFAVRPPSFIPHWIAGDPAPLTGSLGGKLLMQSDGNWTYTMPSDKGGDSMSSGDSISETFEVRAFESDRVGPLGLIVHGQIVTKVITIKINAENDRPTVQPGVVQGDIAEGSGDLIRSGSIGFRDVDLKDQPTATVTKSAIAAVDASGHSMALTSEQVNAIAKALTITPDDKNTNNGSIIWKYDIAETSLDFLAAGQKVTAIFTITVDDQHGGTVSQDVTIGISGSNDAATIGGDLSGKIGENDTGVQYIDRSGHLHTWGHSVTGTIDVSDVDSPDRMQAQSLSKTTYGTFSMTEDGRWTYTLDKAHDELNIRNDLVDHVKVKSADGTEKQINIVIKGSNDAAVISGDLSGKIGENDTGGQYTDRFGHLHTWGHSITGTINVSDVDSPDRMQAQSLSKTTYGTFSMTEDGRWTYTLDKAHDELNIRNDLVDHVKVKSADGTEKQINIVIKGSNDAAVISGDLSGKIGENDTGHQYITWTGVHTIGSALTGKLDISDVDNPDLMWGQWPHQTKYGTFSMDPFGNWTYTLDKAHDELNVGRNLTDRITVYAIDGTSKDIFITIVGSNDPAIITGDDTGSIVETDLPQSVGGKLSATDVDGVPYSKVPHPEYARAAVATESELGLDKSSFVMKPIPEHENTTSFIAETETGKYGSLKIAADGTWVYTMDSAHNEFQQGQFYIDTFKVQTKDGTEKTITITIEGTAEVGGRTATGGEGGAGGITGAYVPGGGSVLGVSGFRGDLSGTRVPGQSDAPSGDAGGGFNPNALLNNAPTAAGFGEGDLSEFLPFELAMMDLSGKDDFAVFLPAGEKASFALPADMLQGPQAVDFAVFQANGEPLPDWLVFDPITGKFLGKAPEGMHGTVRIQLTGRDAKGIERVIRISVNVDVQERGALAERMTPDRDARLVVAESTIAVRGNGRPGLSDQLQSARRGLSSERLARVVSAATMAKL